MEKCTCGGKRYTQGTAGIPESCPCVERDQGPGQGILLCCDTDDAMSWRYDGITDMDIDYEPTVDNLRPHSVGFVDGSELVFDDETAVKLGVPAAVLEAAEQTILEVYEKVRGMAADDDFTEPDPLDYLDDDCR